LLLLLLLLSAAAAKSLLLQALKDGKLYINVHMRTY
jgi:hypothetical protein